ncbi:hypothetical protein DL98DRAFT_472666 [Cadophora sp. DSE1049]|nr:hypothetical protein DL98DRAFT_472666 [Cadophora sp. DSE1049]
MAHQAKRPYAGTRASSQSAITSYFTQAASSSTVYETGTSPNDTRQSLYSLPPQQQHSTSSTPSLPHSVQSNLLNVGMRVRKSVPEGYKTGSYSAFTLFTDSKSNTNSAMPDTTSSPARKTRPRSGNRELTPFCGILKVGGMAGQQWGIYNPGGTSGEMDEDSSSASEDEVPFLSSQGSTISSSSIDDAITPGGNKRRFFEDEEPHLLNSPLNFGSGSSMSMGDRVLAVPRRKKIFGQENFNVGGSGAGVGREDVDFEDAEFLDYGLAGEVEMSGCN